MVPDTNTNKNMRWYLYFNVCGWTEQAGRVMLDGGLVTDRVKVDTSSKGSVCFAARGAMTLHNGSVAILVIPFPAPSSVTVRRRFRVG